MTETEKWRYRCPRGHTSWEITGRRFWCRLCYHGDDEDGGRFDRVYDQKRDERLTPAELKRRSEPATATSN